MMPVASAALALALVAYSCSITSAIIFFLFAFINLYQERSLSLKAKRWRLGNIFFLINSPVFDNFRNELTVLSNLAPNRR